MLKSGIKLTYSQINEEEECWTSTANIVKDRRDGGENKPGHKIYEIIGKAIDASRPKQTNEGFNMSKYYAYYNYFQRPAIDGDSLEVEPIDSKKATEVFRKVINVLKPDIVCVVSSKVWYNMEEKKTNNLPVKWKLISSLIRHVFGGIENRIIIN